MYVFVLEMLVVCPLVVLPSTMGRSSEFMLSIFESHIRPLIDYGYFVWNSGYVDDSKVLESIQNLWTRNVMDWRLGLWSQTEKVGFVSVKGRLLRADLIILEDSG